MIQTIFWSNLSFISKFETRYNHIFQNSRGRKKNRLENSYATLDLAAHFSTSANVPSTALERLERVDKDETRGGWPCHKFELPRALRPEKEAFHASNSPRRFARFRFLAPQPAKVDPHPLPSPSLPRTRPTAALSFPSGHENFDSPIMRHERGISFPIFEHVELGLIRAEVEIGHLEWIFQIFMNNWWTRNRVKWDEWREVSGVEGMKINFWPNLRHFGIF